jgi:hypothetical protein
MYFNTESISYNVNIQPDIMQNYWKNMRENHNILKWPLKFFGFFFVLFYYYYIIIKNKLGQVETGPAQLSHDRPIGSPTNHFFGFELDPTQPSRLGWNGSNPWPTWLLAQLINHVN